jgi:leader peptidase (prepilin peptidase) / N-methyltransferase
MTMLAALVGAAVGAAFAPFSSALTERPPLRGNVSEPLKLPFRCRACRIPLGLTSVIPVVSFFAVRGNCRSCRIRIPRRELVNDVLCLGVGALTGFRVGLVAILPAMLLIALVLVPVSLVDLELRKIATRLVYPAALGAAVLLVVAAAVTGEWDSMLRAAAGGLGASAFFWLLWFIMPSGMGDGDARLMVLLGLGLGWLGWLELLYGIMAGFILGSIVGIFYGIYTKRYLKEQLPFGPWLGLGAMLLIWMRA